ncbi:MAG: hypothetical protein QME66_13735, partial [Candidatus Eisenbacteria bacterium]|nr:hypothetical protein [Candidatus Eisenbacteria bacterium]
MRHVLQFIMMVLFATVSMAWAEEKSYWEYRKLIDDQEQDAIVRNRRGQKYLRSLKRKDFLAFVREVARQPGYDDQKEGHLLAMAVFAKSYLMGPGQGESLHAILEQFSDPMLPVAWKAGLLDVLDLENREDLSDEDIAAAIALLSEMGQNKQNIDGFRSFCLGRLGSLLYSQRELITRKAPDLKDALEKQDRTALPKRDDANVKQAAKLIDAIGTY